MQLTDGSEVLASRLKLSPPSGGLQRVAVCAREISVLHHFPVEILGPLTGTSANT